LITIRKLVTGFREIEEVMVKTVNGREWLEAQKSYGGRIAAVPAGWFSRKDLTKQGYKL
jgi:DNA mismatch repair protein MutH